MPLSYTIITQPVVDAVVAEIVEKALLDSCCFVVGVDIGQGIQRNTVQLRLMCKKSRV
jgi:hypothetical protein